MPSESTVLIVDDNPQMVVTLSRYLRDHGFKVETAAGGAEAVDRFGAVACDVVLTDLRMKGMDGMDLVEAIHRIDPQTPVVLMTAFGNVESAVDAMQRGAYHYVTKPFKMATVRVLLERAAADGRIRREHRQMRAALEDRFAYGLVGRSAPMRELRALIGRAAHAASAVLLVGETGTGKELVARALHRESARRDAPFVAVSCAAMPEVLLESELFGHTLGAFPGATAARRGLFVEADRGTLFLDEVADMPLALQGKLVRVLESGEIRPVGGETSRRVDVRILASTHADLAALVANKHFREDLFFRLNVVPIRVPPLRERRQDVPLLVEHFLGKPPRRKVSDEALRALEAHSWPGNVRELENVIERMLVTGAGGEIDGEEVRAALRPAAPGDALEAFAESGLTLDELEERYVAAVLRRTEGNKARAASILGIDLSTLYRRSKQRS